MSSETMLVTGWQPIETAPKDGTRLLFGHPNSSMPWIGYWYIWNHYAEKIDQKGYWSALYGGIVQDPTHWMPLPEAPKP